MGIPMNLLMKRLGADLTLPIMTILWGVVCACQGIGCTFLPQIADLRALNFRFRCGAFLPRSPRLPVLPWLT
jgi:hypothetical protein